MSQRIAAAFCLNLFLALFLIQSPAHAQVTGGVIPQFELIPAPPVELPSAVDSNSSAFWRFSQGQNRLHILTSWENPTLSVGLSVQRLRWSWPVRFSNVVNGGRWIEAVLEDGDGTLYGYYHNEPLGLCGVAINKTAPRIGAVRSLDGGFSWEDLGIILEVPLNTLDCFTPNGYFAGGIGDFSVILDEQHNDAYFFFSTYWGDAARQGVAVARMPWAQRNTPQGNLALWDGYVWRSSPASGWRIRRWFFEPQPIFPAAMSWHDPSGWVDAFWGPSIHWNTYLNQYVMLLNRAADSSWLQEGIYISFSPVLDDPSQWTTPIKIMEGGDWYPQVIGLARDQGTDKLAGSTARFFMRGRSDYFLVFRNPSQ
jgi:hypothetical protein